MENTENKQFMSYICGFIPYGLTVQYKGDIYDMYGITNDGKAIIAKPLMSTLVTDEFGEIKPYFNTTNTLKDSDFDLMKSALSPNGTAIYKENGISTPASHFGDWIEYNYMARVIEFLKSKHIDYFGFIEKGLAIEAPDGMYSGD